MKRATVKGHKGWVYITCPYCLNLKTCTPASIISLGSVVKCPKCFDGMLIDLVVVRAIDREKRGSLSSNLTD